MRCPNCQGENTRVVDTRKFDSVIFRVRLCEDCMTAIRTEETLVEFRIPAQVVRQPAQVNS